ncbi:hypothetical protein DFP72DRAFT_1077901 [Ephemerocybe angulata]|uniref:Uncharacterized protein n=1 Tax=Ephemerocybe angulata TaxID=980116 RepID=A0A8H6HF45_9AGAR|nr:hypothetical protein DFP72DRAFT_1077901 [Tulosesus angulatus]
MGGQDQDEVEGVSGSGEAAKVDVPRGDDLGIPAWSGFDPEMKTSVIFDVITPLVAGLASASGIGAIAGVGRLAADIRQACYQIRHNKSNFRFLSGEVRQMYAMIYAQYRTTHNNVIKKDLIGVATILYSLHHFCKEVLEQSLFKRIVKKGENERRIFHYRRQFKAARDALIVKSVVDIRRLMQDEVDKSTGLSPLPLACTPTANGNMAQSTRKRVSESVEGRGNVGPSNEQERLHEQGIHRQDSRYPRRSRLQVARETWSAPANSRISQNRLSFRRNLDTTDGANHWASRARDVIPMNTSIPGQINVGTMGNAHFGNNAPGAIVIQSSSGVGYSGYY